MKIKAEVRKTRDHWTGRVYVWIDGRLCYCVGCSYQMGCLLADSSPDAYVDAS